MLRGKTISYSTFKKKERKYLIWTWIKAHYFISEWGDTWGGNF
jgi:hypothetical protein